MQLYDFHHINTGSIVEVLYGDARSFNVTKEYAVVSMRYEELGPFSPAKAYATVDVDGKLEEYRVEELSQATLKSAMVTGNLIICFKNILAGFYSRPALLALCLSIM